MDMYGGTPLHYAYKEETAKLLLRKGANINLIDNEGKTPLHYAKFKGHFEIANLLEKLEEKQDEKQEEKQEKKQEEKQEKKQKMQEWQEEKKEEKQTLDVKTQKVYADVKFSEKGDIKSKDNSYWEFFVFGILIILVIFVKLIASRRDAISEEKDTREARETRREARDASRETRRGKRSNKKSK